MRSIVIPIFVPHLGCPHTCVFCNQKKIAGNFPRPTSATVRKIACEFLDTIKNKDNVYVEVAFYGGSFTGIPTDWQEELLGEAYKLKKENLINGIRLSTRPDYINEEVIKRLLKYEVSTVELGVQSLDENILIKNERCHTAQDVDKAIKLLREAHLQIGIQLMPGLAGDTRETVLETTRKVLDLKPNLVRIYPTVVIKETKLAKWFREGEYHPWSLEQTIDICAEMLILFLQYNIKVIRIGLQATENLQPGKDLLGGPYHPALGELVKSRVFRKQMEFIIINNSYGYKKLSIACCHRQLSKIKGQHSQNIKYLQEKYNLKLEIQANENISMDILLVQYPNGLTKPFSLNDFIHQYTIN